MTVIRFEVPGKPVSTNQAYRHAVRRGRSISMLTPEAMAYKSRLIAAARAAHRRAGAPAAVEGGAVVGVRFVFPTMGSDADGPLKLVIDSVASGTRSLRGAGLIVNDTRVRRLVVEKADADRARPSTSVAVAGADAPRCPSCGCVCGSLLPEGVASP